MKCRNLSVGLFTIVFICASSISSLAMPPHPELLEKIKAGEIEEPAFFKNIEELRSRGIDTPVAVPIARQIASGELKANFNAIAILVDFSDNTSSVSASYFDNLLFGTGTGTLRDYWEEATYGNLTVVTVDLPSSTGWLRAPNSYSYYVNGYYGFGSYPQNAQRLAEDAVNLADPYVDFSDYDNDSDGYVDALFIIHADQGAEYTGSTNDIWSHKWSTHDVPYVDGVYAYIYSMEPEYWASPGDMTCGVYAHEMGHAVFGLPDLYDYDYDSEGLGDWSLMAGGSWNGPLGASPSHPDAYCRILTGAVTATNLTSNLMGATIPAVENTPTIYRLWTNGAGGSEYFMVENRRQTGYDSYLDGQGLMIYHVDETQDGNDNQWYPGHTSYGNYEVALEQADGDWDLEKYNNDGDSGDPYPGSSTNRTFDKNSTPDSKDYDSDTTMVAVRNISNSATNMTADLYVTVGDTPDDPSITVTYPNGGETLSGSATITWTATDPDPGETALLDIDLEYSSNGGGSWNPIATGESNDGSYLWDVSGLGDGSNYLVRATATDTTGRDDSDQSDAVFTILNTGPPTAIADLMATLAGDVIHLSWSAVTEDTSGMPITVDHYVIYRHDDPDFTPASADSVGSTLDIFYDDPSPALKDTSINNYYVAKAVDDRGRKSSDSNKVGEFDSEVITLP
jgi:M6 family metalloprotease-like protein